MTRPYIIVLGNEKGGSGKSTTAMHLVVALLRAGHSVGSIDLDSRQGTLSRYVENRAEFSSRNGLPLPMPAHRAVARSALTSTDQAQGDERRRLDEAIAALSVDETRGFLVIDCPGTDSFLSRRAHSFADTLITPINDSFIDLDLLARIDPESYVIKSPSLYSEMVWECRKRRALRDGGRIDWIVMRNRVSGTKARNKQRVGNVLKELSRRIGFRFAPGFGERVVYRELFLKGLTLMDLRQGGEGGLTMSEVAARQEVRTLLGALGLGGAHIERQMTG